MPHSAAARRRYNRGLRRLFSLPSRILDGFENKLRKVDDARRAKNIRLIESQNRFRTRR